MRAVIQRVNSASVHVGGKKISSIGAGILTLLGVGQGDTEETIAKMMEKICGLRIFSDDQGKMNRSIVDIKGEHLIVSQFTLLGDCTKGRRPSFIAAEKPERANELYEKALIVSAGFGVPTKGGQFQTDMKVQLENDGPVTFVIDINV